MNIFIEWALLCLAAEAAVIAVHLLLRKKQNSRKARIITIISEFLVSVACATIVLAGPVSFRPVQPFLFALYAVLFADALGLTVYYLICAIAKKERKTVISRVICAVFAVAFIVYGTVNMQIVKPDYHTYYSPKISGETKIVFAADIHVGGSQPFEVTEKTVKAMLSENADCIILGGDITDDYTTAEEMKNMFALFAGSETPVYYVYGNHDRQAHADYAKGRQFTEEELAETLAACGITALIDEYAAVNDELVILGREDDSVSTRKDIKDLPANPNESAYLVVADHQPVKADENLETGMDLQLSGHTHAGQLFPLGLLYRVIGASCGEYKTGNALLYVSPGACGWRMPIRTQSQCRYEVITLMPMK